MSRRFRQILGPWFHRYRWTLILAIVAAALAQGLGVALPLLARWTVRSASDQKHFTKLLMVGGALFFSLALLRSAARWAQRFLGMRLGHRVLVGLRGQLLNRLVHLSYGYFERRAEGKVLIRFVGDANALRTWMSRTLIALPADVITVILVIVATMWIRPMLGLVLVVPMLLVLPIVWAANPSARRWTREVRKAQSDLCSTLGDIIANQRLIKASGMEDGSTRGAMSIIEQVAVAGIKRANPDAIVQAGAIALTTLSLGAVVVVGAWLLAQGELQRGDLLAVIWLALNVRGPVQRIARANVVHQRAIVALDRIAALLDRPIERGWGEQSRPYVCGPVTVAFRKVSYKDAAGQWTIKGFTQVFAGPGAVLLFDEGSGAGSSVLDLMLRIRRPHRGRIYHDDADIRFLPVQDVRRVTGLITPPWKTRDIAGMIEILRAAHEEDPDNVRDVWNDNIVLTPDREDLCVRSLVEATPKDAAALVSDPHIALRVVFTFGLMNDPQVVLLDGLMSACPRKCQPGVIWRLTQLAEQKLIVAAEPYEVELDLFKERVHLSHHKHRDASRSDDQVQPERSVGSVNVCGHPVTRVAETSRRMSR